MPYLLATHYCHWLLAIVVLPSVIIAACGCESISLSDSSLKMKRSQVSVAVEVQIQHSTGLLRKEPFIEWWAQTAVLWRVSLFFFLFWCLRLWEERVSVTLTTKEKLGSNFSRHTEWTKCRARQWNDPDFKWERPGLSSWVGSRCSGRVMFSDTSWSYA